MKTCGDCIHWKKAERASFGICWSPLPSWLSMTDEQDQAAKTRPSFGKDCEAFARREKGAKE